MLYVHCDIINIGNKVYFKPIESHSINYNCMVHIQHRANYYNIEQIFDIRRFLVNNSYIGNLYLYAVFYDDNRNTHDLSKLVFVSTINLFDRYKTKNHGIKSLEYKCYSNFTANCHVLKNREISLLYLGNANKQNFRVYTNETSGCFTQHISTNGNGYLSINMIVNKPLNYKYTVLLGFNSLKIEIK